MAMESYGSILDNLANAFASARRLRGHPVYQDTLIYWDDLVQEARRLRQNPSCAQPVAVDEDYTAPAPAGRLPKACHKFEFKHLCVRKY